MLDTLRPQLRFLAPHFAPHFAPHVPADVARDSLMHNYRSYSRTLENVVVRQRLDGAIERLAARQVTLVHGDVDQTAPLKNVLALAKRHPHWRAEVVEGVGHHLPILRSNLLAALLAAPVEGVL